jgi:hypothetical protein
MLAYGWGRACRVAVVARAGFRGMERQRARVDVVAGAGFGGMQRQRARVSVVAAVIVPPMWRDTRSFMKKQ